MILDLRQFDDFPAATVIESGTGEVAPFREDISEVGRVIVDLTVQKAGEEYFCQGNVTGTVKIECARCLEAYALKLSGQTDFIICSEDPGSGRLTSPDEEDYVFFRGNDLRADITDIVKQTLVLATPMKPICSEDCKGLCPVCGTNRNHNSCTCGQDRRDSRWEGLAGLSHNT